MVNVTTAIVSNFSPLLFPLHFIATNIIAYHMTKIEHQAFNRFSCIFARSPYQINCPL